MIMPEQSMPSSLTRDCIGLVALEAMLIQLSRDNCSILLIGGLTRGLTRGFSYFGIVFEYS